MVAGVPGNPLVMAVEALNLRKGKIPVCRWAAMVPSVQDLRSRSAASSCARFLRAGYRMNENLRIQVYYGLPQDVVFCKKCCYSNQRPGSTKEFAHTKDSKKVTLAFDEEGVRRPSLCREEGNDRLEKRARSNCSNCSPSIGARMVGTIASFPAVVARTACAAHVLKYKYGMNPLTVTWPPIMYGTDYGYQNFRPGSRSAVSTISHSIQNGRAMKTPDAPFDRESLPPVPDLHSRQKQLAPAGAQVRIPLFFL